MLPKAHRLRRPVDYRSVARSGVRSRGGVLQVNLRASGASARVGFVVPRSVGGAVVRNTVRRRLRHLMAGRLEGLAGYDVVIRVHSTASQLAHGALKAALDRGLRDASARTDSRR